MKILYIIEEYDDSGLYPTMENDLLTALMRKEIYVSLISSRSLSVESEVRYGGLVTMRRVDVSDAFTSGLRGLFGRGKALRSLRRMLKEEADIDMVVVSGYGYYDKAYKVIKENTNAVVVCDMLSTPIVGLDSKKSLEEQYRVLGDREIWERVDKVIVGSEMERETLLRGGVATAKVEVVKPWRVRRISRGRLSLEGRVEDGVNVGYVASEEATMSSVDKYVSILMSEYIR